ncbi:aldolase/citrate lyase family protein [Solwaraspora sp. WMMD1047]|uniref:HpcH/HpaI aldolase family protein n=1 Tax=Solwaraspora sp. WMMD1047 TaxID=3016102 RepID=UPI0024174EA2|nr:aldolase/citrate lyase family protein [Solwaraspora sp. WMMD1047]MDG4830394.1 aldolase/citrate lyase family protein [Solwaraspora sp. WMMD1047]
MTSFRSLLGGDDGPALGMFVKIPAPELTEIIAGAGVQFVVIDTEHALLSVRDVYDMTVLYASLGVRPLVRVADHGYGDAQRYLDAGVDGLLFPHVSDGAEAAALGRQFLFPPRGARGMGFASRAGRWGMLPGGRAEYLRHGDDEVARVAMVEERGSVDDIDAILAAEGIDAVFIGPSDLALSMGASGKSPEVSAAIDHVIERAVAAGKPVGTVAADPADAARRADQGCDYLLVGNDTGIFARALRTSYQGFRAALTGAEEDR